MPKAEFSYVVRNSNGENLGVFSTPEKAADYIADKPEWAAHMLRIQLVANKG
jgi:hypothetical protein